MFKKQQSSHERIICISLSLYIMRVFLSRGKPKKGRTASRDGKRIRPSSEAELDDEDDPDLSLR